MPKFAIHFEEIQRRTRRNIEEQNKVFGSSKIAINCLIIILMHSIIVIFLIKSAIGKRIWLLLHPVRKENFKTFRSLSHIRPVRAPILTN